MRLLADENFPRAAVEALRADGHDVVWVRTDAPGISDPAVLRRAQEEDRLVVTLDKDFGELAFRHGLPAASGILLFRIPLLPPHDIARLAKIAVASRDDWNGCFAVIEPDRIRFRSLPANQE